MYKLHLILKYLRKRRIAWVSLVAVMLCTALVIVVISVMGGWLRMFREQFHGAAGDVIVSRGDLSGFPHYQEMIDRIRAEPGVRGAVPIIRTYGLVNVFDQIRDGVQVVGMPLEQIESVSNFRQSLFRQFQFPTEQLDNPDTTQVIRQDAADMLAKPASFKLPHPPEFYREQLPKSKVDVSKWDGMVVGSAVVGIHEDEKTGRTVGRDGLVFAWVKLTVLGVGGASQVDLANKNERMYWIVDDSRTKLWQIDQSTVYVPFERLQADLGMDHREMKDENTGETLVEDARATEIQVGLTPGTDEKAAALRIQAIVDDVLHKHGIVYQRGQLKSVAWFDAPGTKDFLDAVQKEIILVTFLFGLISIVAVFLIFCIFFMIVVEKTRDIGIVKSVGATNWGVAQIFLGYGLAIGIVGSLLGLLVAYLIVRNINEIHTKLGEWMGIKIWDAKTYAFDTIPNTIDPNSVAWVLLVAIIASLLGAVVPALRAARMHPIEALRWE